MIYLIIALILLAAVSTLSTLTYFKMTARYKAYRQQAHKQITAWKKLYEQQQTITSEQQHKEEQVDATPDTDLHQRANNLF